MDNGGRIGIAVLALSAAGFVGILSQEGYSGTAVIPVPGDKPTIGFGTTDGVRLGDSTTPPKALVRAMGDIQKKEAAIRQCVTAPLFQHEYDAYTSLAYNIGETAFCNSTLVKKANAQDYPGACGEILRWKHFQGKDCSRRENKCYGIWERRNSEYRLCMGAM